ncbi:glutamine synthetase bacteria [Penicillium chermesinum]|nr:glutamine synthetase bacteria [Penicillium chermesinum]
MTSWRTEDNKPLDGCPRTALASVIDKLYQEHEIDVKCGFEIELMLLKPVKDGGGKVLDYKPATEIHSWSQITADTRRMLPVLEEVHKTLAAIGIELQQFHAESSPGQFEFILPPASPLQAVDTLIAARRVVTAVAERHGYRATLHPRPFPDATGNASHTHVSISRPEKDASFLAGILAHFHSIMAFTLPQDISYERVRSGIWAGSEWVSWGFQNREAPIRKISPGHWEFRLMDGLANPYLALAAVLAGGLIGLESRLPLRIQDCTVDASTLTDSERAELGITQRLPRSLFESLQSLEKDTCLQKLLGTDLVRHYVNLKMGETKWLSSMGDENRRVWLIERY